MKIETNRYFDAPSNHLKVELYSTGLAEMPGSWQCGDFVGSLSRLYYVISGEGTIISEGTTITVKPGYVYFVSASITWTLQCETPLCVFFVNFNLLTPNGDVFFTGDRSVVELPFPVEKIEELATLYRSNHAEDLFFLKTALYQTISDILRTSDVRHTPPVYSPLILNTIHYILENLSSELRVADLAQRAFVSKAHLSSQFKKEVGQSIGHYIDSQIVFRARIELEHGELSIAEISSKFGFCDQFYFSRFFKKYTGQAPLQYRKRHAFDVKHIDKAR